MIATETVVVVIILHRMVYRIVRNSEILCNVTRAYLPNDISLKKDKNELKVISTRIEDEKKNSILRLVNDKRNRYITKGLTLYSGRMIDIFVSFS